MATDGCIEEKESNDGKMTHDASGVGTKPGNICILVTVKDEETFESQYVVLTLCLNLEEMMTANNVCSKGFIIDMESLVSVDFSVVRFLTIDLFLNYLGRKEGEFRPGKRFII